MNANKKGAILGISVLSLLLLLLMASLVFAFVVSGNAKYKNYNEKIKDRITIKTLTQEVYVNICGDLKNGDVKDIYWVEHLGASLEVIVNYDQDTYAFSIIYKQMESKLKIDQNGIIIEWVIN